MNPDDGGGEHTPLDHDDGKPKAPAPRLQDPVVFITGASSGIGAAAAGVFAGAGYQVVLAARRAERLEQLASALRARFPQRQFLPLVCDVNSDEAVAAAFGRVREQFGKLDVLVNNAGYGVYGTLEAVPVETFRRNLETNVLGVVRCTQAALPLLRAAAKESSGRWGAAIVMVGSIVGRRAMPQLSAYSASKFALEGLSESLRIELRHERISVSVINPGVTQTEFQGSAEGARPDGFLSPGGGMPPQAVARKILQAVRRPRRNRYLTAAGRAGVFLQWLAPGLFDRILAKHFRRSSGKS